MQHLWWQASEWCTLAAFLPIHLTPPVKKKQVKVRWNGERRTEGVKYLIAANQADVTTIETKKSRICFHPHTCALGRCCGFWSQARWIRSTYLLNAAPFSPRSKQISFVANLKTKMQHKRIAIKARRKRRISSIHE